ncbi:MAG: leucine-rich repeat domain-containing protein [Butyricicoccus sp.]
MKEFNFEATEQGMVLTSVNGAPVHAVVPETYDGKPVYAIGKYAFSGQKQLKSVSLPRGLEEIRNHAFYNCGNLERLNLSGGVRSISDGAFKNCKQLHAISMKGMRYLSQLLPDLKTKITLTMEMEDGQTVSVLFPEYDYVYMEFVQPRLFRAEPYGSGSFYRMCVSPTQLDFAEYDKAFSHAILQDDPETILTIALLRLQYPYRLREEAREKYRSYLAEHAQAAAEWILGQRDCALLEVLLAQDCLDEETVQSVLAFAAQQDVPEAVSLLMEYRLSRFGGRRKRFTL